MTSARFQNLYKNKALYNLPTKPDDWTSLDLCKDNRHCVKCGKSLGDGSEQVFHIKDPKTKKVLLFIYKNKYKVHCSGGCRMTCIKLNYCFRCGNDRNIKECDCAKYMTDREHYIHDNLIYDIEKDLDFIYSLHSSNNASTTTYNKFRYYKQ